MHWLLDVDNFYGYGRRGDGTTQPSYINTFQRGPQESVWETVPQPSWEDFQWGAGRPAASCAVHHGSGARRSSGATPTRPTPTRGRSRRCTGRRRGRRARRQRRPSTRWRRRPRKMGDYLRYAMFDKYFKKMGCTSPQLPGRHRQQRGALPDVLVLRVGRRRSDTSAGWAWRIGSSHNHFGYQNPMAALGADNGARAAAALANGARDWTTSLDAPARVLPLAAVGRRRHRRRRHQQLGRPLRGAARRASPTFYGMFYQENPVYHDPGSNTWFGFQAWSMERVAEYYYATGDAKAKLDPRQVGPVGDGEHAAARERLLPGSLDARLGRPAVAQLDRDQRRTGTRPTPPTTRACARPSSTTRRTSASRRR